MVSLFGYNNRKFLELFTKYGPTIMNPTRWSSCFEMIERYFILYPVLHNFKVSEFRQKGMYGRFAHSSRGLKIVFILIFFFSFIYGLIFKKKNK